MIRNSFFFYVRSRVLHSESNRIGLALLRAHAILWWEVSTPVLLFSRGIFPIFYGVATFGEKNQEEISSYISTFHPKMGPIFRVNRVLNIFWGNRSASTFFKTISWRNGKRRWMPLPKWLVGLQEKPARFFRFPGQTRLRRCWNLHFQFLKPVCHKRWPKMRFRSIQIGFETRYHDASVSIHIITF